MATLAPVAPTPRERQRALLCSLYGGRLHDCSTVTAPLADVIGYNWRYHAADILGTRQDGSLAQCIVANGAASDCIDVPPPP